MSLLSVENLTVTYGGITAVADVNLSIQAGELTCLIGANGAGKTSTLKALCGLIPTARGQVRYQDQYIQHWPVHRIARAGMVLVPEGRGIFNALSVAENLLLGAYARRDRAAVHSDLERFYQLFERLAERRHQKAGTLSGGEQQMLALARALMSRPKILLLDEPSMGLAPLMVQKIFAIIQKICQDGVTVVLVEQNANLALRIGQRAYVMENGRITLHGTSADLLTNPAVRSAYLGDF